MLQQLVAAIATIVLGSAALMGRFIRSICPGPGMVRFLRGDARCLVGGRPGRSGGRDGERSPAIGRRADMQLTCPASFAYDSMPVTDQSRERCRY